MPSSKLIQWWFFWCLLTPSVAIHGGLNPTMVSTVPRPKRTGLALTSSAQSISPARQYQAAREMIYGDSLLAARTKLNQAFKAYQALDNSVGQYNCQIELARIEYKQGKYQQARYTLRSAVQYNNYTHTEDGRAKTLSGLINVELDNYHQALGQLETGIQELQVSAAGDRLGRQAINESRIALAEVYFYHGLYQQAESAIAQLLKVTDEPNLRHRAHNTLGLIQMEKGLHTEAKATFEQAAAVAKTKEELGIKTLENLGRVYQLEGNKAQAFKQYQQALQELRRLGAENEQVFVLNNLGLLATDLRLKHSALKYFQSAEKISSSGGVGRVLTHINLGQYYSQQQQYGLAVDYLEKALSWASSKGDRLGQAKALAGLGEVKLLQNKYQQASQTLESSLEIYESLRPGLRDEQKNPLVQSQKFTYDLLQQAYVANQKPQQALVVAERSRTRAMMELLAQNTAAKRPQKINATPPNLPQIKAIAKNRQATLVSYAVIENRQESQLYIWVINPQGEINFRQLDLRTFHLQDYMAAFRGNLKTKSGKNYRKLGFARDAYKMLITPIQDLLPESNELVIFIPQDALFFVPFSALQDEGGEFLIEQHTIQTSPSIQTLAMKQPYRFNSSQALIVGSPAPLPESLIPLAGAESEATAIAKILATTPVIGEEATETAIVEKMPQAQIIHLATHGLFNEHQGLQSSLAFSTKDNQDGFLTAENILDLDLTADLVVLSACNIGRGKITGDGVVGLSNSFLLAGAQTTMVSLWDVRNLPTSVLMSKFYQQLMNGLAPPQALRQAMLSTIEIYPSPQDWAAFTLLGQ